MFYGLKQRLLGYALASVLIAPCSAWSQGVAIPVATSPTLADLYAMVWQRHPAYAAQEIRQKQFAASSVLAQSFIAGTPSASVGYRGDGATTLSRTGLREWDFGVSTPLAVGDRKRYATETVRLQEQVYSADIQKIKWLLAGDLREAYWNWQLAHIEHQLAEDEVRRARVLVDDSKRRTSAGETPRVDTLQAQSVLGLAEVNLAETLQKEAQALSALQRLTGAQLLTTLPEEALSKYRLEALQSSPINAHPVLASSEASLALNKTKLDAALRVRGDPPTLGTGFSRETSNSSAALTTARLSLSFAIGSDKRYAPKIAEASADAVESEIVLARQTEQLQQEINFAKTALEVAGNKMNTAQQRAATSTEAAQLFAKAFALGELDMPTRLRAETDRAAAVLAMNRAVIEHALAVSKLNQLMGYLP